MKYQLLFNLLFLVTAPLGKIAALEAPSGAAKDLDRILSLSDIEFPGFTDAVAEHPAMQERARELMVATQKARTAIAAHIVDSSLPHKLAKARANALQAELMKRVQTHFAAQLSGLEKVEDFEWDLHRGLTDGAVETNKRNKRLPERGQRLARVPTRSDVHPDDTATIGDRQSGFRKMLSQLNLIRALRRWKIQRLLSKLSRPSTVAAGNSQVMADAGPQNMEQLRASLSSLTATKSSQSRTAAAESRDAAAADRIANAPLILSDVNLDLVRPKQRKKAVPKMPEKLPGWDGTPEPRRWADKFDKGPEDSWTNMPIPGMEP